MTWTINSVDTRTVYGLVLAGVTGWQDMVPEQLPTIAVPGVPGLVRTSAVPIVQPRRLVATGYVGGVGSTLAIRAADARTKLHGLRALLSKAVTVEFYDRPGQFVTAQCEGIAVPVQSVSMLSDKVSVVITLVCRDPYFYDGTVTVGALGGPQPQGTGPTRPVITTVLSSAGIQVMHLQDNLGNAITSLALIALNNGDTIVADMAARTIKVNGVLRPDVISGGDFWGFDVVTQGDYATSAWPQAFGNYAGTITYRKAYR